MNYKFLKTIGCLATALALTACSSEEMADGTQLPEGKYPITITATGLEVTPVTRATVDGTWKDGDVVAVQVGKEIKKYIAEGSGENVTLKPFDADNTFYWKNTDDINVTAWSLGRRTPFSYAPPQSIYVAADQTGSGLSDYDFIYAHGTLSYTGNKSLTFYHQTAKVVVHVLRGDDTPTGMTISSLMKTRELSREGYWVAPTGEYYYGETTAIINDPDWLSPFWPLVFNAGTVTLPENVTGEVIKSYKFLVIPQEIKADGSALFIINPREGAGPFNYIPTADITWEAGREYTYYITIKGSNATKTVSRSVDGTSNGTAELLMLRESSMDND